MSTPMLPLWVGAGVVLAAGLLRFAGRGGPGRRSRVLAVGLVVAALVYVPFALAAGDTGRLVVELAGVAVFAVPAYLGVRGSSRLLAAGWVGHVAWDVGLHLLGPAYGPAWYAALCIGFDLVVAGGLLVAADRVVVARTGEMAGIDE